jgi:hypothetical protein
MSVVDLQNYYCIAFCLCSCVCFQWYSVYSLSGCYYFEILVQKQVHKNSTTVTTTQSPISDTLFFHGNICYAKATHTSSVFLYLYIFSPDDDPLGLWHVAIIKTSVLFTIKNSCVDYIMFLSICKRYGVTPNVATVPQYDAQRLVDFRVIFYGVAVCKHCAVRVITKVGRPNGCGSYLSHCCKTFQ